MSYSRYCQGTSGCTWASKWWAKVHWLRAALMEAFTATLLVMPVCSSSCLSGSTTCYLAYTYLEALLKTYS